MQFIFLELEKLFKNNVLNARVEKGEKMKIIAFYLPQFHCFPENDKWWGKGFTEWTNVKNAKPLFEGHNQPRVPLNNNYYTLTDKNVLKWQSNLAKEYGIYGFCYYHYWFNGKMLMEKPMEIMLEDRSIDLPFCICWANENWTKAWAKRSKEVLIAQKYDDKEDWEKHFQYFLSFFSDPRYIRINNKPVLVIYRPELIPCLKELLSYWNEQAKESGFQGICFMYQHKFFDHTKHSAGELFDYGIEYQPSYAMDQQRKKIDLVARKIKNLISNKFNLKTGKSSSIIYDYDMAWQYILKMEPKDSKMIPGAFVDWDNTPRYKNQASLFTGVTPDKFEKYLTQQIENAKNKYHKDMIFMFAWNEWGEGGYLEPDETTGFKRLEAVKNALIRTEEFPQYP